MPNNFFASNERFGGHLIHGGNNNIGWVSQIIEIEDENGNEIPIGRAYKEQVTKSILKT